jgi:murein DD-endopeptidase MepM/ murein hydrolase activator NlpD
VVDLATLGQKGNIASQLAAGTVMQHEAHRNGVYDGVLGQEYETQRAVTGHTEMALRVAKEYGRGFIAQNAKLSQDVAEYVKGPESFARYVGDTYDSSVDYWKLKRNGDLINDGDGWLKDENGRYILDNQGNRVGAKGIETGLTKILGLDPSNAADVSRVQQLMMDSGMVHSNAGNAAAWMWGGSANAPIAEQFSSLGVAGIQSLSLDEANKDKTIISSTLLADFGDTVVAPLLMNGLDTISDLAVLGGSGAEALARTVVPGKALDRYDEYVADKRGFYFGQHVLLGDTQSAHVSLEYGPSDLPAHNGQHKGTDIADTVGTAISAFYGGKVVFSDSTVSAGNTVIIANGFNFEGFFYDTGVQSQFMHLLSPSAMQQGDSVSGRTFVGNMGYSGDVDPFGVAGTHLHYQLMGDLGGQGLDPTSVEWDMYRNRRDTFLSLVGSRPMWDYSVLPTSTQNYWSQNYSNFYFDSNEVMRRLGISAAR